MIVPTANAKLSFFDRRIISRNWSKINRTPLRRAGLLVRKIQRQGHRRGKKGGKPAAAGTPVKARQSGKNTPVKLIFSIPDNRLGVVTIGQIGFSSSRRGGKPFPQLHEEGGTMTIRLKDGRLIRARYPARPSAGPALKKAKPKIPKFWEDALAKSGVRGK